MTGPWDTVPAPNYAAFPNDIGNALSNLVSNYQQAQQGQQRTQANDLRNKQDQMLLDQSKAFAAGVPMNPDGTPNYAAIMNTLAKKGDINSIQSLAPIIQQQQWMQSRTPSSAWDGSAGGSAAPAGGDGGTSKGTYSLSQMIQMAEKAGFQGEDAAHVAAIAMAESGGDPGATGKAGEVGLTQINPHAWGFADSARDPQQAFNDAYQVYKKQGWGAWSTDPTSKNFTPGNSMARYLPKAEADLGSGGGGTQVASLGGSDASAYASAEAPAVPPVSASAGGTIPRADGGGSTPKGAVGGVPAAAAPQQWAANGPAWTGINAALPVGPPGAPAQTPAASAAPQAPVGPGQGSVASLVSGVVSNPQMAARVAGNVARVLKVDPGAPLTPEQVDKAKRIVQGYAQRTSQPPPLAATAPQAAIGGQGPASAGAPIIPQVRLPWGLKDSQEAIVRLDQEAARLASSPNPYDREQAPFIVDYRNRIAAQSAPRELGNALFDPRTGKMILQGPNAATARTQALQGKADDIAEAIQSGDQPPVLTGLYGVSPLVRSKLAEDGFDLSKAQIQWDAAKKQVMSLNGPQQVRFVGLANSVVNTVDEVNDLAQQMQQGGIPLLNRVKLEAYIQTQGNSEQGQLATRYLTAVNTLKEEFANLANGGYAPTEPAWKLADQQINGNYGVKQLGAALTEAQRLIKYRLNAMPGMSSVGPGAANPYFPGGGQAPNAPAAGQGQPQAGGAHPPGNYNYDPATGNLEPVK